MNIEQFKPLPESARGYRIPVLTFKGRYFSLSKSARRVLAASNQKYFSLLLNEDTKEIIAQPSKKPELQLHNNSNIWTRTTLVHKVQKAFVVEETDTLRMVGEILPDKNALIFKIDDDEIINN
ncbi:hypothetical protein [Lactiplantibacillus plantarum]|uniref:hypothetical protein n=1 Tax=Lactiplantibacillus plantarum TaxID=1590 RepID=UPI0020006659|nr:hypothetical protein [Lactiplantibacillus plantarum]